MNIKLLDCTLRDGGYVNDWYFKEKNISRIIGALTEAHIDYVEVGFLQKTVYAKDKTLFSTVEEAEQLIALNKKNHSTTKYYAMIDYGSYPIESIPVCSGKGVDGFRITFRKKDISKAMEFCLALKEKGYEVFCNPLSTPAYSDKDLIELIDQVNAIHPTGLAIVDSLGIMQQQDVARLFSLYEKKLHDDIIICFHSHNNLQLSFSNAQFLLGHKTSRTVIVDVTIFGMGRGAGNLCTELFVQYVNDYYNSKYDILPILKVIDEIIQKIYLKTPWGYSVPYYLAAKHACHPNYATYLSEKQSIPVESINTILSQIIPDKKGAYDSNYIKGLYLEYQGYSVDDTEVLGRLQKEMENKTVLVLAPGKTLLTHNEQVQEFIKEKKPYVFVLNTQAVPYEFNTIFISNVKRFTEISDTSKAIITSNIKAENIPMLNYERYINASEMHDNSALMLCKVLIAAGVKEFYFAGMDGFSSFSENYYDIDLANMSKLGSVDRRNEIMKKALEGFSRDITINYITPSPYKA